MYACPFVPINQTGLFLPLQQQKQEQLLANKSCLVQQSSGLPLLGRACNLCGVVDNVAQGPEEAVSFPCCWSGDKSFHLLDLRGCL